MRCIALILVYLACAASAQANPAATAAINDLRADQRRAPLVYSNTLERAAAAHGADMARRGFFAHQGSDGSSVGDRVNVTGYRWCFVAENIAKGQSSLAQVMGDWTRSRGHYRNMIHRDAQEFAVVRVNGNIWVMVLAKPC